jgi:hypothetical protein
LIVCKIRAKFRKVAVLQKRSNGIFQPYIKTWLKIKTESSEWPKNCTTPEEKLEFIQEFYSRRFVLNNYYLIQF